MFTLEPLDNVGDFETFLSYLKLNYTESKYINKQKENLILRFKKDFYIIEKEVNQQVALTLVFLDKIDIVFELTIEEVNDVLEYLYKYIFDNVLTLEEWNLNSEAILEHLNNEIKEALE